jgi:hypothetical protein
VTRRGDVLTSTRVEVTPWRGKGGDATSWVDVNLIGKKKKIHAVYSIATNGR